MELRVRLRASAKAWRLGLVEVGAELLIHC